ncbi:MAG TPA: hypothetical protein VFL14_03040 [Xanthomonadales bacterium]|nr:hypothetical protein [Xanthomonadales bacterium]
MVPLLVAVATSACEGGRLGNGNPVLVPDTNYSVVVPDGWWLRWRDGSPRPALSFFSAKACESRELSFPELEVARLQFDDRPGSLDDFDRKAGDSVDELRGALVRVKVGKFDAVEYAATGNYIAIGGGSLQPRYYRVVVLHVGDDFYECRLTEDVWSNGKYETVPRTLCATLAVRADARPGVP